MKYAIAPVLLAAAAVLQALGRYVYHQDTIVVVGELFFPIFLAGVSIFYGLRAREGRFATTKLALLILGVVVAALTAAGWGLTLFWFYPSIWIYYAAFLLLVVHAVIAVVSTPSAKQLRAERADDDAPAHPSESGRTHSAETTDPAAGDTADGWRTARR